MSVTCQPYVCRMNRPMLLQHPETNHNFKWCCSLLRNIQTTCKSPENDWGHNRHSNELSQEIFWDIQNENRVNHEKVLGIALSG